MKGASAKKAIGFSLVALALGAVGVAVYKLSTSKPPEVKQEQTAKTLLLNQLNHNRSETAKRIIEMFQKGQI